MQQNTTTYGWGRHRFSLTLKSSEGLTFVGCILWRIQLLGDNNCDSLMISCSVFWCCDRSFQNAQSGPQPQSLYHSGPLSAPTPPNMPPGHTSPQGSYPIQGYSIHSHQGIPPTYPLGQIAQVWIHSAAYFSAAWLLFLLVHPCIWVYLSNKTQI